MKILKILLLIISILITSQSYGQDYTYQQDAFDNERINIYDNYGNMVGYYKVDAFDNSKINVYDSYGNLIKTVENDTFD